MAKAQSKTTITVTLELSEIEARRLLKKLEEDKGKQEHTYAALQEIASALDDCLNVVEVDKSETMPERPIQIGGF